MVLNFDLNLPPQLENDINIVENSINQAPNNSDDVVICSRRSFEEARNNFRRDQRARDLHDEIAELQRGQSGGMAAVLVAISNMHRASSRRNVGGNQLPSSQPVSQPASSRRNVSGNQLPSSQPASQPASSRRNVGGNQLPSSQPASQPASSRRNVGGNQLSSSQPASQPASSRRNVGGNQPPSLQPASSRRNVGGTGNQLPNSQGRDDSKKEEGSCMPQGESQSAASATKAPSFTCPICMAPFDEETSTKCGHIFCKECIDVAIAYQGKCPTCRRKLKAKDTLRIYLPKSC